MKAYPPYQLHYTAKLTVTEISSCGLKCGKIEQSKTYADASSS